MIKTNKTKLQFFLGAILLLSFTIAACNNEGKKTVKDEAATETKTATTTTEVRDSTDSMVKMKGNVSPTPGGGN